MKRIGQRLPPLALLAVICVSAVYSQSSSTTDTSVPADPNKSYRVGVSVFRGEGLSPDNEYLLQGIPLLLVQTLSALQTHHFDPPELRAYQKSVLDDAIAQQKENINKLLQTRSAILFQSSDPQAALEASSESLNAARQRLSFLEKLDPDKVTVESDKPIELVQSKGGEQLVAYPDVSAAQTCKELNLGMLVWGSVAQVEDYLVVHIEIYDVAVGHSVYAYSNTYAPNNVLESASDVTDRLVMSVLGRDFGNLTLDVEPTSAMVYVDGAFYGIGGATIRYMKTGKHHLEFRAPGYSSKQTDVTVLPLSETTEHVTLEPVARPEVVVSTIPNGADVYLASEWKGKTPVVLSRPATEEALMVRLKGYHEYTTTLDSSSPLQLQIRLLPDVFKSQDYVADLRNRFYSSFGAFAVSTIAPVSFYSLMQDNLVNLEVATSPKEAEQLKNQITVWYYSFLGGAFISSALFANTVMDIIDYLQAIR